MESAFGHDVEQEIRNQKDLREHYKQPSIYVSNKQIDHIDDLVSRFLAATSLAILATRRSHGGVDLTPRGDPPGFLKVLDRHCLALPDRPGNNRVDAYENIINDPAVGLLCIIPGHRDTIRIDGEATIVRDSELFADMAVKGKQPASALIIRVKRLLCHCPKAFIRSHAWEPNSWPDTSGVPSLGEMMVAHGGLDIGRQTMEGVVENDSKNRLY